MNEMNERVASSARPSGISPWGWLGIVGGIAVLERLVLWVAYSPVIFDDTNSYRRLAGQLLGSAPFDGTRSPGFPIFLAWLGPDRNVYAVQLVLGLAITLLFFYLGWLVSGRVAVGATAALIHTLNLGQLLFEADLLAETLTTFFAVLAICAGVYLFKQEQTAGGVSLKKIGIAFVTGAAGGLASLVRPQFVFLPFLIALWLVLESTRKSLQAGTPDHEGKRSIRGLFYALTAGNTAWKDLQLWLLVFAIFVPALFLNGLWVNYIHSQFGAWSMSSDDGYHLIQHTGKFFEYVPDEDAAIRDTFLKYRTIQIANTGSSSNTIWAALPALQKISGLGFYKLSRKLQEISLQLIREHPLLYLGSIFEAWAWFWSAPFYWAPQQLGAAQGLFGALVQLQRIALWGANAIFILGTFALLIPRVRKKLALPSAVWLFVGIVWVNSILQAVVEASENPRYSVSTQTLVLLVVAWCFWKLIQERGRRRETL